MTRPDLQNWLPVATFFEQGEPCFEMARLGTHRFTEPFFEEGLMRLLQDPFHQVFRRRVSLAQAQDWLADHPGLPPAGFIFHVSRCGSTWVSQMLASRASHRVLSEPGSVDRVLRSGAADAERTAWLRVALGLLGQPAQAAERRLFVKFDSWHCLDMALIRAAYPEVPCLVLVREPVEVIASHLRMPGAQMVPGMLGYSVVAAQAPDGRFLPREDYMARVLAAYQDALLAGLRQPGSAPLCLLDYAELGARLDAEVWPLFGWQPDAAERAQLAEVLARDAKSPSFSFEPDAERKRREAGPAVHAAAEQHCAAGYAVLRALAGRRPSAD